MSQLSQFGLQQGVVAGIVHQREVILELRIETDREQVLLKRDGMSFEEIGPSEWAGAANGFEQLSPEDGKVLGRSWKIRDGRWGNHLRGFSLRRSRRFDLRVRFRRSEGENWPSRLGFERMAACWFGPGGRRLGGNRNRRDVLRVAL